MSYCANAYGNIQMTSRISENNLAVIRRILSSRFNVDVWEQNEATCFELLYTQEKNWEDDLPLLEEFSSKYGGEILTADVEYTGEDGLQWRLVYVDGDWVEQNAHIIWVSVDQPKQDTFGSVCWSRTDIRTAFGERFPDIPVTDELIEAVFESCQEDSHFTDAMIEAGWYRLYENIRTVISKKKGDKE